MESESASPIFVVDLLPEIRTQLLDVLESISESEWRKPTTCEGWSVKDVALNVLGDDVAVLSRQRDNHGLGGQTMDWQELVDFVNDQNALWVRALRRMSSRLLCDMLRMTGAQVYTFFRTVDPFSPGGLVSWAGTSPAPQCG